MKTPVEILRDEITLDPLAKGYAALLPGAQGVVVEMLNALTETALKPIKSQTALAWAAAGPYSAIVDAGNNPAHPCRASCLVIQSTMMTNLDIHIDQPEVLAMFTGWVSCGIITHDEFDDLINKAMKPASRAEMLGLNVVTGADLAAAMEIA